MMASGAVHTVERVGIFGPKPVAVEQLGPGEIGFINAGVKTVSDAKVGDTITDDRRPCAEPLTVLNHLCLLYSVVCFQLMLQIFLDCGRLLKNYH